MYVSMDNVIMQFKSKSSLASNRHSGSLELIKNIEGYTPPTKITLRKSVLCMGLCEGTKQLWVSNGNYLDIIECDAFKVDKNSRINLKVLLPMTLCDMRKDFVVEQITSNMSQVFCALSEAPYVLEFCAKSNTCTAVFSFDKKLLYNQVVGKTLNFQSFEHSAYKAVEDDRKGSSSDFPSSPEEGTSQPGSPEEPSFAGSPPVPPRHSVHQIYRRRPPNSPAYKDEVPVVPPRPGRSNSDKRPNSDGDGPPPPRPPKPRNVMSVFDTIETPPTVPPRISTLPAYAGRMHTKGSNTLPYIKREYDYSIYCTSIAAVGDTLWVGRDLGDICIVNVSKQQTDIAEPNSSNANSVYGKVIASMYDLNHKYRGSKTPKRIKLVPLRKYVISAYTLTDLEGSDVEIVAWDSFTAQDVERVENHWRQILCLEKALIRSEPPSSQGASICLSGIGEF